MKTAQTYSCSALVTQLPLKLTFTSPAYPIKGRGIHSSSLSVYDIYMPDPPRVLIAIVTPSHFYFPHEHVKCLLHMVTWSYHHKYVDNIDIFYATSPDTRNNRNDSITKAREMAKKKKCDYVLMIDTDMTFKCDLLFHMIETEKNHPDSVITGLGCIGAPPFYPAIFRITDGNHHEHIQNFPEDTLFEVDACGSFCMLIPMSVINKLPEFPFDHLYEYYPENKKQYERELRHDLAFSKRCRDAGIKIICSPVLKIGHLRPYAADIEDFIRNRDNRTPMIHERMRGEDG